MLRFSVLSSRSFAPAASALLVSLVAAAPRSAVAQTDPRGAPPPDIQKAVNAPAERQVLKIDRAPEGTTASVSAGGLTSSGNSRMLAFTGSGQIDSRVGDNGFGAAALANYGRSAPPGEQMETTTENFQGKLRYDRYLLDDASLFLLVVGRRDRLQGLALRMNIDPGFKYLFVNRPNTALWGELGYDFQYDLRTEEARTIRDDMGAVTSRLDATDTDHSSRAFLGFRHAFNEKVTVSNGMEYLQSFVDSDHYRVNYDVLFTANLFGRFALGAGFNARFDNAALPGKEKLDTSSTLSLVYSYSSIAED